MAVVLETQMLAAASSIRFITKLGGSNLIIFHCRDEANDEEDSTMQRNYAIVLQFFELTSISTLLHQFLVLITDQLSRPTCHPGRDARDYDQSIAVDQSAASFSCEDDDQCRRHQYAKIRVSSSKRVELPSVITCPDGGHRCLYIPCPICRNSRAGKFEDRDSSADDLSDNTTIIKRAVVIGPVACGDRCNVHKLGLPCEDCSKFYTKKVNITGSRAKSDRLPAAITSCPDVGRHRYPYSSCAGKSQEDRDHSSSTDDIVNNANIKCEVEAPAACPHSKEFPCKECHRVRRNPTEQSRKGNGSITSQAATTWPDGGRHRCTYFPCPICHPGR